VTGLRWSPAAATGGAFTPGNPAFVVIHCTESDNNPGTAESLAGPNWFGGPKAGTSAHRIFDRDSGVEMVRRTTVAYHAGPRGNTHGLSYELCGRASWTAAQWRAPEQLAMLRGAAPHIADDLRAIAAARSVDPLAAARWLSVVQVAQRAPGLCTHNDVRLAFPGTTTHSDPGPNFPYAELLGYVRDQLGDDDMTPEQFAALLRDPAVRKEVGRAVWEYGIGNNGLTGPDGKPYDVEAWRLVGGTAQDVRAVRDRKG
jgi:N-acetyl-anhydromuramyl-L-alanine amidase AmpD